MIPLSHIIRRYTGGYKLHKLQEKISYIDDIKQFARNEKELENIIRAVRRFNDDIGIEFSIENVPCSYRKTEKDK